MNKFLRIVLILLMTVCIFDPADKLLGLKVPLFALGWFLFGLMAIRKNMNISKNMIIYLTLFILIPLVSIAYYFFTGSDFINYDGYIYFKPYLFLTLAIILYASKIDLIKPTVAIITLVSIATIVILIVTYFNTSLMTSINDVGRRYGIVSMGRHRNYGSSVLPNVGGVYFHVANLIVFPVGYFTIKTLFSKGVTKTIYGLLLLINMAAMFFSATRNNIIACLLVPISIVYWYSKRKIFILCVVIFLSVLCIINMDAIKNSMFRPDEHSNRYKLSFLKDYLTLFADEEVLLFGQGLGSYFNTTMRGYVSLTELTYFEFIRRFGLILSLPSFALLLYPLSKLRLKRYRSIHYLFIVYLFYLIMTFFNPFLMSSSGMLLLSIILYKTFSPVSLSYIRQ